MKKMLLAAFALLLCVKVVAQNANVVLYTENGERFYAILNGMRMNDEPVTNIKVQDLNQPGYGLKVIFENKELGEMNKNMMVEAGSEAVYAIRLDKKGGYKLVFRSSVPMAQAAPPAPQQHIVYWGAPVNTGPVVGTTGTVTTGTTVTEQTTMTTTTTSGTGMNTNGTTENVSMNVNTDGFGLNINVSGTGMATTDNVGMTGSSTTVTTTTTTTTSGTGGTVIADPVYVPVGSPCMEMMGSDFEKAKASISSKSFEDSKMTLAKQITSKNCLSAAQVKSIMQLFDFEASKLEYAKYAYDYCWEKNNYYQVNDAFDFESSISDLDAYIGSR